MVLPSFPHYERLKSTKLAIKIDLSFLNLFLLGTLVTMVKVANTMTFLFGLPQMKISYYYKCLVSSDLAKKLACIMIRLMITLVPSCWNSVSSEPSCHLHEIRCACF